MNEKENFCKNLHEDLKKYIEHGKSIKVPGTEFVNAPISLKKQRELLKLNECASSGFVSLSAHERAILKEFEQ